MDSSGYVSIILGFLLSTSEILPYIKNIKGNGIVDTLHRAIVFYSKISDPANQSLLPQQIQPSSTVVNIDSELANQLKLLTKPIQLESLDKYEMNYIINYIQNNFDKRHLLIHSLSTLNKDTLYTLNYNVDFDSQKKMYNISW